MSMYIPDIIAPRLTIDNGLLFDNHLRKQDKEFLNAIGAKINDRSPCGWAKLSQNVDPHTDNYGRVLLYVAKGATTLGVSGIAYPLNEGFFLTFNDYDSHWLDVITRTTTILVVSVTRKIQIKDYRFLGNL